MQIIHLRKALSEVKDELKTEKDFHRRLGLLAAKSWILRKKLYVTLHDPYISALSEVEDTDIFDGLDDEDYNDFDSLFDEDTPEGKSRDSTAQSGYHKWEENHEGHYCRSSRERGREARESWYGKIKFGLKI
jgi:hypothetical protein